MATLTTQAQDEILTGLSAERCKHENNLQHDRDHCPACQEVVARERVLQSLRASNVRMTNLRERGLLRG